MRKTVSIHIREPIWATRSIGIADHKIIADLTIYIEYRDKLGKKLYPHKSFMTRGKVKRYPTQTVKGVLLRIVPIGDLMLYT